MSPGLAGSGQAGAATAFTNLPGYSGDKKLGLMCKDILGEKASAAWKGTWTIFE